MTAHLSKWVRHYSQRLPWRTLSLTLSALLLYWLLGPAPEALTYEREAIAAGEWWRLLTGHWVHSDLEHLLFDVTAMAIVLYLFEKSPLWQLTLLLTTATVVIDAWLWWQMPWLQSYCGLSGLLNALLSCGLLVLWKRSSDPAYLLIGALAALKITIEISLGDTLFTTTAWAAVPEAHAAGMVTGLLLGIFFTYIKNLFWKTKKTPFQEASVSMIPLANLVGCGRPKRPTNGLKKG
ncbi:MAG: rhombosortase [Sedimenticola sp.]